MVLDKIKAMINEQFSIDENMITAKTTLEDLGADSLDVVELIMSIEEEFDIEVADEDVEGMSSVGDLVDYINDKI